MNFTNGLPVKQTVRFTFRRYERLSKTKEIKLVLNKGKKIFIDGVIIYLLKQDVKKNKYSRLAVLVSSKIEKLAVVRNKFKRRIREIFRLNKHKIKYPVDIVVIPTKKGINKNYKQLENCFIQVLSNEELI
ncbi:MAG: ribonuclease P protein component [Endomicrobia bacterium]|nr:ribonuclease P protein component [Endomicrobiia bacterium]MCX7716669.1 ribonuclease P protein component [Endomicrobiia bacterium]